MTSHCPLTRLTPSPYTSACSHLSPVSAPSKTYAIPTPAVFSSSCLPWLLLPLPSPSHQKPQGNPQDQAFSDHYKLVLSDSSSALLGSPGLLLTIPLRTSATCPQPYSTSAPFLSRQTPSPASKNSQTIKQALSTILCPSTLLAIKLKVPQLPIGI